MARNKRRTYERKFDVGVFVQSISDKDGNPNPHSLMQAIRSLAQILQTVTDPVSRQSIQAELDELCAHCGDSGRVTDEDARVTMLVAEPKAHVKKHLS